jgi:3',5'-cyclic AMP phosphodiesterase CpdA
MFEVSRPSLSRRQLLQGGLALAAWTLRPSSIFANELPDGQPPSCEMDCTRWALLSDTHIAANPRNRFRGFYPYRNLQEVVGQLACDPPDGLVITGDLARLKGQIGAYESLKTLLTPIAQQRPIHLGLGNHDNRDDFFQAFAGSDNSPRIVEDRHVVTAAAGPVRLIVLDTLRTVNALFGSLGPRQRTWLESYLFACDETPTILFLHHTLNSELVDTRRLLEIIRPLAKIKAVVYGHSHQYRYREVAGIHLINLPATGFNFSSTQPVGWVEARLTRTAGEFTLHAIGGDREMDGHTHTLTWRS